MNEKTKNLFYAGQSVRILRVLKDTYELTYIKHPEIVFQCSKGATCLVKERIEKPIQSSKQETNQ